jgi:hypothetical protein
VARLDGLSPHPGCGGGRGLRRRPCPCRGRSSLPPSPGHVHPGPASSARHPRGRSCRGRSSLPRTSFTMSPPTQTKRAPQSRMGTNAPPYIQGRRRLWSAGALAARPFVVPTASTGAVPPAAPSPTSIGARRFRSCHSSVPLGLRAVRKRGPCPWGATPRSLRDAPQDEAPSRTGRDVESWLVLASSWRHQRGPLEAKVARGHPHTSSSSSTSPRPHLDLTSTSPRPRLDLTSTSPRPHLLPLLFNLSSRPLVDAARAADFPQRLARPGCFLRGVHIPAMSRCCRRWNRIHQLPWGVQWSTECLLPCRRWSARCCSVSNSQGGGRLHMG